MASSQPAPRTGQTTGTTPYPTTPTPGGVPGIPDYRSLAEQTAASETSAVNSQTIANRPNQEDPYGNRMTWVQDPKTGQWTQKITLGSRNQNTVNQLGDIRAGLLGQISDNMGPLDTSGLQNVSVNATRPSLSHWNPTGNSEEIQKATYGLLSPQRDIERNKEIQRLKNQGLTEGSPAFQAAMTRLGQGDTEAQLKALLAGQQEYGNAFSRNLSQEGQNYNQRLGTQQLAQGLRGDQFRELLAKRNQPLSELSAIDQQQQFTRPEFGSFASAGNAGGVDYSTAGKNTYESLLNNYNANEAAKLNDRNGYLSLISGLLNSDAGGEGMSWLTDLAKKGGSGIWDWLSGLTNGGA